jgi:hypothetical protein
VNLTESQLRQMIREEINKDAVDAAGDLTKDEKGFTAADRARLAMDQFENAYISALGGATQGGGVDVPDPTSGGAFPTESALDYLASLAQARYKKRLPENLINHQLKQMIEEELEGMINEKAKSKSQQRFMGMVRKCQETGDCASEEVRKAAKSMKKKDAKDFAQTKHKGLPEKKKKSKRKKS